MHRFINVKKLIMLNVKTCTPHEEKLIFRLFNKGLIRKCRRGERPHCVTRSMVGNAGRFNRHTFLMHSIIKMNMQKSEHKRWLESDELSIKVTKCSFNTAPNFLMEIRHLYSVDVRFPFALIEFTNLMIGSQNGGAARH